MYQFVLLVTGLALRGRCAGEKDATSISRHWPVKEDWTIRTVSTSRFPDIDEIWPTWEQEKTRLALMRERPQMPMIYQQQDTHEERRFGLRPPEALRGLVERTKGVGWLVKHCMLAFDGNSPTATRDMAI